MTVRLSRAALIATGAFALAACTFSRPPLERTSYLLAASREAPPAAAAKPVAVKVRPMRAVPLYERKEFVYRVDGERVVADFYNEFAESPEAMVTAAVIGWLKSAGLFTTVIEPGVPVDAPYLLEGSIVTLYGDLRDPAKPAGEIAIQFYLVKLRGSGPELVLRPGDPQPGRGRRRRPAIAGGGLTTARSSPSSPISNASSRRSSCATEIGSGRSMVPSRGYAAHRRPEPAPAVSLARSRRC